MPGVVDRVAERNTYRRSLIGFDRAYPELIDDLTISGFDRPISRDLFIYVNTARADANPAVVDFVDYYLSDAGLAAVVPAVAVGKWVDPDQVAVEALAARGDRAATPLLIAARTSAAAVGPDGPTPALNRPWATCRTMRLRRGSGRRAGRAGRGPPRRRARTGLPSSARS